MPFVSDRRMTLSFVLALAGAVVSVIAGGGA